ncbi:malonic semialdehyde reductase [Catellatospora tritici]|uniref:malonic semialdehyde reductase n=1 Tax=Catellatospora tritici TaxID=2851566 RepID=UPI001C2D671B|nr:malonic semialdehyde reductase [Catellatospora tritici]MBV1855551.1 malonic semialdehyde reductase [Catellatospora tritici]
MTLPETATVLPEPLQDLLFRQARTAHAFTDEPVTDEEVRLIHDLVRHGPTAFNSQPLRIVLVRSAAARARLLPHLSSGNRAKTAAAPLVAVLAADTEFPRRLPELFPHEPRAAEWFGDQTAREQQARLNSAMQAGYFLIAVRAAGLAAGPMSGFDPAGVDAEFFPDGRLRSFLLVNIGRPGPNAWRERLPRLAYDEAVSEV